MVIRLLPASVDPPDSTGTAASTSLVLVNRALATRVSTPSDSGYPADSYAWSAPAGRAGAHRIYGTPVEDSQGDGASGETRSSAWEYVSGSAWSPPVERTAAAHYLMYAARFTSGNGQLLNVYA
jgi:hypothetical protein